MKLTQELIDKIQEAMLHTNLKGEINWKDGDDIEVQIAGTFAKDKFIVLKNATKNPFGSNIIKGLNQSILSMAYFLSVSTILYYFLILSFSFIYSSLPSLVNTFFS